jgi:hypothetical protein
VIRIRLRPDSEIARRTRRAALILAEIDSQVGAQYGDPAELVAMFVEHELDEPAWEALGATAGYDPPRAPSLKTRGLVLALIRARATRGAA